jgi:hypothetical protein
MNDALRAATSLKSAKRPTERFINLPKAVEYECSKRVKPLLVKSKIFRTKLIQKLLEQTLLVNLKPFSLLLLR